MKTPSIPVHLTPAGTRYVRLDDIPEPHRESFSRYLRGAGVPDIDGKGPLAFEIDWLDWLHQRRRDRH